MEKVERGGYSRIRRSNLRFRILRQTPLVVSTVPSRCLDPFSAFLWGHCDLMELAC